MNIKQRNKILGFTLIELLIVIAIVAIIAGAVLVAMNPARRINESNDARRWTDIKSVSDALGAYVADTKGQVPDCGVSGDIPNDNVYRCLGTGSGGTDYALSSSLISLWNLDEASNNDRSDSKATNDLTETAIISNSAGDKVQGQASTLFDGTTRYLSKSESLSGDFPGKLDGSNYSISAMAWVKIDSNDDVVIAAKYETDDVDVNIDGSWSLGVGQGLNRRIHVVLKDSTEGVHFVGDTALSLNTWHHVAFVYDQIQENVIIYLDGMIDFQEERDFADNYPPASDAALTVGYSEFSGNYMSGLIDELAVFNAVLEEDEIQEIYFYGLKGQRPCCDLNGDLGSYLHKLPEDPQDGDQVNTGYVLKRDPSGTMWIRAPYQSDETNQIIEVSR